MNLVEEGDLLYDALTQSSSAGRVPSRLGQASRSMAGAATTDSTVAPSGAPFSVPTFRSSTPSRDRDSIEFISEDIGLQPVQCLPISLHDYYIGESFRIIVTVGSVAAYAVREVQFEMSMTSPSNERTPLCKQVVGVLAAQDVFTRVVSFPLRETGKYIVEVRSRCVDPAGHLREVTWSTTIPVQDGVVEEWSVPKNSKEKETEEKKKGSGGSSASNAGRQERLMVVDTQAKRVPIPFFLKESMTYSDIAAMWDHRSGDVYELAVFIRNGTGSFVSLTSCFLELQPRSPCKVLSSSSSPTVFSSSSFVFMSKLREDEEEEERAEKPLNRAHSTPCRWKTPSLQQGMGSVTVQGNFFSHAKQRRHRAPFSSLPLPTSPPSLPTTTMGAGFSSVVGNAISSPFLPFHFQEGNVCLAPGERERFVFMIFVPHHVLRNVPIKNKGSQQFGVITSSTAELGVLRWSWERHKGDGGAGCSGRIWMYGMEAPSPLQLRLLSLRLPTPHVGNAIPSSFGEDPVPRAGEWVTVTGVVVVHRAFLLQGGTLAADEGLPSCDGDFSRHRVGVSGCASLQTDPKDGAGSMRQRRVSEYRTPTVLDHLLSSSVGRALPTRSLSGVSTPPPVPSTPPLPPSSPPTALSSLMIKVRPETFIPDWMYEGPTLLPLPIEHWHSVAVDRASAPSPSSLQSRSILPAPTSSGSSEEIWVTSFSLPLLPSRAGELMVPKGALEIVSATNPQGVLWPDPSQKWKQDVETISLLSTISAPKCIVVGLQKQYAGDVSGGGHSPLEPMALITVM